MARLNDRQGSVASSGFEYGTKDEQRDHYRPSPTSSAAFGSDKENVQNTAEPVHPGKRKSNSAAMSSPQPSSSTGSNKRRRLEVREKRPATQNARRKAIDEQVERDFYDPDQDEESKRETTRRLRELYSMSTDSRTEWLQRNSRGIQNTLREADNIIKDVKQTSTATIDSRLLVNVGDIAYKKVNTLTLGDSSTAIDLDDFLTKCLMYMKKVPMSDSNPPTSTQRRPQRRGQGQGDGDEEDVSDLNFAHLGRTLCFPASRRPCLSGFLLGPLSVQKKQRAQTQRRATQRERLDESQAVRPTRIDEEDLERQESRSLTAICGEIAKLLARTQDRGQERVNAEVEKLQNDRLDPDYEPPEWELKNIMRKHNITDNGCVPLFDFCLNPKSFGQTVENLFYVSFLIKEGRVGLDFDSDGMPTLGMVETKSLEERQESVRNQAVFTLDFEIWQDLKESLGIERCVIPNRSSEVWEDDDGVIRPGAVQQQNDESPVEDEDMYGAS